MTRAAAEVWALLPILAPYKISLLYGKLFHDVKKNKEGF